MDDRAPELEIPDKLSTRPEISLAGKFVNNNKLCFLLSEILQ
uniref:Uncharacterized protein n=1 Tax=Megaselia scalaris TaxID=36166 RepID=T1H148_MEGSC